ncbi:Torsin A interacting protein [Chamberlinius hualienensis]
MENKDIHMRRKSLHSNDSNTLSNESNLSSPTKSLRSGKSKNSGESSSESEKDGDTLRPKCKSEAIDTNEQSTKKTNYGCLIIVIIIIVIAIGYVIAQIMFSNSQSPTLKTSLEDIFANELNSLKNLFPNQSQETWKTIRAVVKATLRNDPLKTPGVIAILTSSIATDTANCLGKMLATKVKSVFNDPEYVHLKGDSFKVYDSSTAKLKIDQIIRKGLGDGGHTVLFENFQLIHPESAMLFHGLCDNENAPFKKAIYIFIVQAPTINEVNSGEVTFLWKNKLNDDTRSSLESRIGNSIVTVTNENFDSHCKLRN